MDGGWQIIGLLVALLTCKLMEAEINRPGIVYLDIHLFFARKNYLLLLSFTYYYFHYHYNYHYFINTFYLPSFPFTSLLFAEREAITKNEKIKNLLWK